MSNKLEVSVSIILSADESNVDLLDEVASQIQHLVHEAMLAQKLPAAIKYEETVIFDEDDADDSDGADDPDGGDDPDGDGPQVVVVPDKLPVSVH